MTRKVEQDQGASPAPPLATARGGSNLQEFMTGYQQGDPQAFEALYRALSPRLRSFLGWRVSCPATVEDLLQETFLQIHRSRRTFQPDRPVMPWALAIANYVHLMDRRSRRKRPAADFCLSSLDDLPALEGPASLSHQSALEHALARIDPDQRCCFLLHHAWGYSFKEIGRILGITPGAAKNRSFRAARALQGILDRQSV